MASLPVDVEVVRRLQADVGGERADLQPLLDVYLREAPEILDGLGRAIQNKDAPEVRRLAHSLKSSSAMFGAATLSGEARELEASSAAGELKEAPRALERLKVEFQRVKEALLSLPEF